LQDAGTGEGQHVRCGEVRGVKVGTQVRGDGRVRCQHGQGTEESKPFVDALYRARQSRTAVLDVNRVQQAS
jgi:hypothetical protein